MRRIFFVFLFFSTVMISHAQLAYPPTRTVDSSDTYWGKTIKDPYRWLENIKSKEVEDWFKAQALLSDSLLNRIPGRDSLVKEWMSLDSLKPANYSEIVFEANRLFYRKTKGGENIGEIYWRADWDGDEKLLFDPTTYQKGVVTTVVSFVPSYDGKNVALALSSGGAEVSEIRILNVDDGTLYPEGIFPTRGPICWTLDNMSLVYLWQKSADNKSPDFELNLKTKLHEIGADTSGDIDFFSNGSYPELNIAPNEFPIAVMDETYPDYVFGYLYTVQPEMRVYYAPAREMENSRIDWKVLCTQSDSLVRGMEFHGDRVYAITLKQAHNYKLVSTRIEHPDWDHAEIVLPEQKDVLQYIVKSNDHLLAVYSNGITGRVLSYHFNSGKTTELSLPMSGTVDVSCPDRFGNRFLVTISSWTSPTKWYDYDADKDFFAEYLVKEGYTSPARLAGMGTSAGGILISRAITERPDLFGAAICNVGCANAMRMEFTPNGPPNIAEFGTVKDSLQCLALYEMDGVQHVQPGVKYPSVICVAGWNDPRVVAWEPGKFAAALQQATASGKPVLMKVNYESGHFTEEKLVTFRNFADQYSFILWQTGHPGFQPLE